MTGAQARLHAYARAIINIMAHIAGKFKAWCGNRDVLYNRVRSLALVYAKRTFLRKGKILDASGAKQMSDRLTRCGQAPERVLYLAKT